MTNCGTRTMCGAFVLLVMCTNLASGVFITLGVTALLGGSAWYEWDFLKENTYCKFRECCDARHVPYDTQQLGTMLSYKIYGQPMVSNLVSILEAHKESLKNKSKSQKAEVISLHGWSGVGKNFAANIIAEALYKAGMNSQYVIQFQGEKIESGEQLYRDIESVVKKCPNALIILDEVHEMDPGILDKIKPMLDHHHYSRGVDYRQCVFIFISNIGGPEITEKLLNLYDSGMTRDEVELKHFEQIIRNKAFFMGGFNRAAIVSNHLIDHYIPFLPLEQQHVEQCARREFRAHGVSEPTDAMWEEALSVITYGPTKERPIFANSGCKRLIKQVPYVIIKHRSRGSIDAKSEL